MLYEILKIIILNGSFFKINRFQSIKRFSRFVSQNERQKYVIHQVKEEFIIIYQLSNFGGHPVYAFIN